jgi:hypothetical protein
MPEEFPPPPPGPPFDKIENFNFLLSRTDPAAKAARHYSFDADTGLVPFVNVNMDYDQTEGMGGLSVSSYDSIDDDRGSLDLRGYPYHGTCTIFSFLSFLGSISYFLHIETPSFDLVREVASVAPSVGLVVRVLASGRVPLTALGMNPAAGSRQQPQMAFCAREEDEMRDRVKQNEVIEPFETPLTYTPPCLWFLLSYF